MKKKQLQARVESAISWRKIYKNTLFLFRSNSREVFLGSCILKTCSQFTREQPCRKVVSIKSKNTSGGLLLIFFFFLLSPIASSAHWNETYMGIHGVYYNEQCNVYCNRHKMKCPLKIYLVNVRKIYIHITNTTRNFWTNVFLFLFLLQKFMKLIVFWMKVFLLETNFAYFQEILSMST